MTYRPASLDLATAWDPPEVVLPVPSSIAKDRHAGICLLDAVTMPPERAARIERHGASFALRIGEPRAVRVTLTLVADRVAARRWHSYQYGPDPERDYDRTELNRHRTFVVRAGTAEAAVVLARRPADVRRSRSSRGTVVLDVDADAVEPGGLVVVNLLSADAVADFAGPSLLADPLVGVGITRIDVEERPAASVAASVSTGAPPQGRRRHLRAGYAAVNPGSGGDATTLVRFSVGGSPDAGRLSIGRVTRRVTRLRAERLLAERGATVDAVTLDGTPLDVRTDLVDEALQVRVPPRTGPVLLRPRLIGSGADGVLWFAQVGGRS